MNRRSGRRQSWRGVKDVAQKTAEKQQAGARMPLCWFCGFGETLVLLCAFLCCRRWSCLD
jgi:hypothetical protein